MKYLENLRDVLYVLFELLQIDKNLAAWPFVDQALVGKETTGQLLEEGDKSTGAIDRVFCEDFLKQTAGFAGERIFPAYVKFDGEIGLGPGERGVYFQDGQVHVPPEIGNILRELNNMGLGKIATSAEIGGFGLPFSLESATVNLYAGAYPGFSLFAGLTLSAARVVEMFGDDYLKQVYLPKLVSQEWLGTMAMTEPKCGSYLPDMETRATFLEGKRFFIKGTKLFISCGDHGLTENIIHMVLAQTKMPNDKDAISLFLVPKFLVGDDGKLIPNNVGTAGIEDKLGLHGSPTCTLGFDGAVGFLLGELGQGLKHLLITMMNEERLFVGNQAVSTMSFAYMLAVEHAKQRRIGERWLIEIPDVRRMLIECKCLIEGWRTLVLWAAFAKDMAKLAAYQGDDAQKMQYEGLLALLTPLCKQGASDAAKKVIDMCKVVFGGYGYILENIIALLMRDCHIFDLYEGANPVQEEHVVTRILPVGGGVIWTGLAAKVMADCEQWKVEGLLAGEATSLANFFEQFGEVVSEFVDIFGKVGAAKKQGVEPEVQKHIIVHYQAETHDLVAAMNRLLVGYALLWGGVVAQKALNELDAKAEGLAGSTSPDVDFYSDKVTQVSKFFNHELPLVDAFFTTHTRLGNGFASMTFSS